jgi:hypothetical protein
LLGCGRVLFAPESQECVGVEAADQREPMHARMAGAAKGDQPEQTRVTRPTVVDDQRGRAQAGRGADPAEPPVAFKDRGPVAGKAAAIMLLPGIAGRAQAAL